jgi:hypothetical protein
MLHRNNSKLKMNSIIKKKVAISRSIQFDDVVNIGRQGTFTDNIYMLFMRTQVPT